MKNTEIPEIYSIKKTPKETLANWYHLMAVGRKIDDRAPNYLKQAIGWSYHAPFAGHDGRARLMVGKPAIPLRKPRAAIYTFQG